MSNERCAVEPPNYSFLADLEAGTAEFLAEVLALPEEAYVPLPDSSTYKNGYWDVCLLKLEQYAEDFPDALLDDNRRRCPKTWARLSELDGLIVAGFMRLTPGTIISEHTDIRDDNVIRVHLALQLPEADRRYWRDGTARLMDIRQPHHAENLEEYDRITLCCDFRVPEPIPDGVIPPWNPPEVN
jgi:hypothetical protein